MTGTLATDDIRCRFATPMEASRIVEIIRMGFDDDFLSMTPMGCFGAASYCGDLIREQSTGGATTFTIAELRGEILACLDLRTTIESMHVNYICTIPSARALGVAGRLFDYTIAEVRRPFHQFLQLDVLADNTIAQNWYRRRGFEAAFTSDWYAQSLPKCGIARGYFSSGAQSLRLQQTYGFSEIALLTPNGEYRVGLLGGTWIRITALDILSDRDAMTLLATRFPGREVLVIGKDTDCRRKLDATARLITRTVRMLRRLDDGNVMRS